MKGIEIRLIAESCFDVEEYMSFLRSMGLEATKPEVWRRSEMATNPEELVEAAGRICYMSFAERQSPKSNQEYIEHLIRSGHESVLEHVNWTFLISGVSRAFTHQLVRHRVGFAFSQLSQQYCDESDAEFVEPPQLAANEEAHAAWSKAISEAKIAYRKILDLVSIAGDKASREQTRELRSLARSVLPNATETKIVVTANARALRHFLSVRGTIPGDLEMRLVSTRLHQILKSKAPSIFFDFEEEMEADGFPILVHSQIA